MLTVYCWGCSLHLLCCDPLSDCVKNVKHGLGWRFVDGGNGTIVVVVGLR